MSEINNRETRKRILRERMVSQDDSEEKELEERSERKKKRRRIIWVVILIIALAAVLGVFLFRRYFKFSSFETSWSKDLNRGSFAGYKRLGNNLLKFSRDGATCYSEKGEELWTASYEMKNPAAAVNGKFAVIADQQGTTLQIFSEDGKTGTATTNLPIVKAAVSSTGVTAVTETDQSGNYITFFKKDGTALDITIKMKISGDGFPVDIALSPDGNRLMVSNEYIDGQDLKGRVLFYDFSEIGKNIPNRLVGAFIDSFSKSLVARVVYLNPTYSFAVADTGIYFFSSKNLASPTLIKEITESDEIQTVFYSEDYAGLILKNTASSSRYRLEIYKADGTAVFKKEFNTPYTGADIDDGYVFVYGSGNLTIYNMAGTEKFSGEIDPQVSAVTRGSAPNEFILAGSTFLRSIRLH
jgi:predicted lipoprotein with Yx(FWY)xxD motif